MTHLSEARLIDVVEGAAAAVDRPLAWRDRALLELGYGAGLRVSELCGLLITDLHLPEQVVRVMGKGSKERLVPL